jgi:hypothetical protein
MATYPAAYKQLIGSVEEWLDDVIVDRATGGTAKGRSFYTAKKRRFKVRHILAATDRAAFQTFYDTNRTLAVTFVWAGDGVTYTCLFEGAPKYQYLGAALTQIDVQLAEQ